MPYDNPPDLQALADCGALVSKAMNQSAPERTRTIAFFEKILHKDRDLWGCLVEGLITEAELRDATIARFATWLSHTNGVHEPSSDRWGSSEIEHCFELALLGRPVNPAR
jgi:hypothetical protein